MLLLEPRPPEKTPDPFSDPFAGGGSGELIKVGQNQPSVGDGVR